MLYIVAKHAWIILFVVVSEGQSISFLVENVEHMQGWKLYVVLNTCKDGNYMLFFIFLEVWERERNQNMMKNHKK
jgi:hypothetical protein